MPESTEPAPVLWSSKYRPRELSDFQYLGDAVHSLHQYLGSGNMPHLLLLGPKNVGKTALTQAFARAVLGGEYDLYFQILWADDPISKEERDEAKRAGRVSATKIGSAAGTTNTVNPFIELNVRPFMESARLGDSPFKILAIKNFHLLGNEQEAFRRLMEQFSQNCRLIIITDQISGVLEPILSRCSIILVSPPDYDTFAATIEGILGDEDVFYSPDAIEDLYHLTKGAIGPALDLAQVCSQTREFVTSDNLFDVVAVLRRSPVRELLVHALRGEYLSASGTLDECYRKHYLTNAEIYTQMVEEIHRLPIEFLVKAKLIEVIAQADAEGVDGNSPDIQMMAMLSKLVLLNGVI
jgi:replication factor C small subunit